MNQYTVIFGLHAVKKALANHQSGRLYVSSARRDQKLLDVIELAKSLRVDIVPCDRSKLDKYAGDSHHQGVVLQVADAKQTGLSEQDLLAHLAQQQQSALLLVLDGVQDPYNLGACLRSADAAGVDAVILPKNRSVAVTPVVRKVACGAAETLKIVTVSNLARTLQTLQKQGVWTVGMDANTSQSQLLYDIDLTMPMALVLGSEGSGLRALTMKQCDFMGYLPMKGQVESLNVSVATGIALFEVTRQRLAL